MKKLVVRSFVGCLLRSRDLHLGAGRDGKLEVKDHTFRVDTPADGTSELALNQRSSKAGQYERCRSFPPRGVAGSIGHLLHCLALPADAGTQLADAEFHPIMQMYA
jgi:hypothetical protein